MDRIGEACEISLIALYLRGLPRPYTPPPRRWMQVVSVLRREGVMPRRVMVVDALQAHGHWMEASCLECSDVWASALAAIEASSCLSAESPGYPVRLLECLGGQAPPAVWVSGPLPEVSFRAIVGSRRVGHQELRHAACASASVNEAGDWVVSGGAPGVDRAAAVGRHAVEVWPFGLLAGRHQNWGAPGALVMSLAGPDEGFSSALAMERNALIYAMASASLVVHSRLREGGTWNGAVSALRKRLSPMMALSPSLASADGRAGLSALIALGAVPLASASEFGHSQPCLGDALSLFG